jgi:hypothetical protein
MLSGEVGAGRVRSVVSWGVACLAALLLLWSFVGSKPARADDAARSSAGNLLLGKQPIHTTDGRRLSELTDGVRAREGENWKSLVTKPFAGRNAVVDYDLGAEVQIRSAWLQGDNNDSYDLEISSDNKSFAPLWTAESVRSAGLRIRSTTSLNARGRYLRLHPRDGDGFFGVSELQVFSGTPSPFPPRGEEVRATSLDSALRDATVLLGLALLAPLLLVHRNSQPSWILVALAIAAVGLFRFADAFFECMPVDTREVSLVRGVLGAVAALAVARELFAPRRFPAHRPLVLGTLGFTGVLGVLAFYNLGQPQFYSHGRDEWTFAHYLDLRQYYTTAKYFPEIGYRGTYEADVASYLEDRPDQADAIADIAMRDLHSHRVSTPAKEVERIEAIKARFTPERWQALKADTAWFRAAMGEGHWLEMLIDFGGNATPVWMSVAHLLFNAVHPSNLGFTLLALLDPLLLGCMFLAVFRCYGLRTALIAMTLFGANDFIMYGTNWGGAILRHDWLAYLGFAACALRRERFALGGALLGLSTMIRVFPALAIAGAALPALIRILEDFAETRKLPPLREILKRERQTVRVVVGAGVAMLAAFAFSLLVLAPEAWPDCLNKIAALNADAHPNAISLRTLIGGGENQNAVLRARQPLFLATCAIFVGLIVLAARRLRIDQTAVLGMTLVPVLLYPANYYIHFVFLLPLLVTETRPKAAADLPAAPREGGIWVTLLGMCAVQYLTVFITDLKLHFYYENVVFFSVLSLLLGLLVKDDIVAWASRADAEPSS